MGPQFQVGRNESYQDTTLPVAVARPGGGYLVVWGDNNTLKKRFYDEDFQPLGDESPLDTVAPGRVSGASVGYQPDGGFVAVWTDYNAPVIQAIGRRYGPDGEPRGNVFAVSDFTAGDAKDANLSVDGKGDFVVVWRNRERVSIEGRRYAASGQPKGGSFEVAGTGLPKYWADVAAFSDGGFVVVWQIFDNGSTGSVQGRVYGPSGETVSDEFETNDGTADPAGAPTVVLDPAGGFLVGWSADLFSPVSNWARRYDAVGQPRGPKFPITTVDQREPGRLQIAMMPDGRYLATFDSDLDGSFRGIVGKRFDADDHAIGSEFLINTQTEGNQIEQSAAIDGAGRFLVVWHDDPQQGREGALVSGRGGLLPLDANVARMPVASASPRAIPRTLPPRGGAAP